MVARTLAVAAVLLFGASCATDGLEPSEQSSGFKLNRHDANTLDATMVTGGASLHLTVVQSQPGVADVTFDFGDTVIAFRNDHNRGTGEFMPSGAPLDVSHAAVIDAMLAELEKLPPGANGELPFVTSAAVRQTSFMQIVPHGEELRAFGFQAQQGWVHISCSCFNQYIGSGYYRQAGKGTGCTGGSGNGCKGRCGTGCSPCAGTTAYTQDCAKHDYGLGSWGAASDDFSFARNNCGC